MGLGTDSIFITALRASQELTQAVSGRIYGTAIPLPDEDADNVPPPYIIVTFDGLNNDPTTKDDSYEIDGDSVQIGILVTAQTLEGLHNLTQKVRSVVHDYFLDNETDVSGYHFSADSIQWDQFKPCYWQTLHYQCDVEL